ncbi:MAG TPA: PQQ-binding-like beta-propeller repeat protein [Gemmataceae bacterium]|nr:PQQ-binding-like beta-propeller repeat protein [Gemmataceae bacterium]
MKTSVYLLSVLVLMVHSLFCRAENWPRWRGPDGNAVSSESPLPQRWGKKENVRWKVRVPGEGFSSPVVWEDRVFLTSAFDGGTRRVVHCLDFPSGRFLWTGEVRHPHPEQTSAMTGHAAPTPATDGRHVVAFFGNAGVVCYDRDGRQLWRHELPEFDSELGLASSPVLGRDRVFLVCDHDGDRFRSFDSFLLALDLKTGKPLWKTDRHKLYRSWSTPILVPTADGGQELVVNGEERLRGYDPETGKELWQVGGMTAWVTPSPVFGRGLIFATSGKDGPTLAVRPGGRGDVTATHVVWQHKRGGPYVCSPVLYGDYLYVHTEQGILSCYEAATGKLQYRERLDGKFIASPVAGDGKVYCTNEDGTTFVVRAGPRFEVLARNALEEYTLASPAISAGRLLLRTERHLYCIGASKD